MKPSEYLAVARELLAPPEKWTQRAFARTATGRSIGPQEAPAVCFDAVGAIQKVCGQDDEYYEARRYLYRGVGFILTWNDALSRTHGEILAGFDAAIALAVAEGR